MRQCSTKWTVGLDLGDRTNVACILDAEGEVVEKVRVVNRPDKLDAFFDRFLDSPAEVCVAMESGTHSPWISHRLLKRGLRVLVGNSRKLRAVWGDEQKSDFRDAEMIARIARLDPSLLYPIHHRGVSSQADLSIIRARDALVRSRSALISCVRSLVKSCGGRLPSCSAAAFDTKVADSVPAELVPAIGPMLTQIGSLSKQIRAYDRCLVRLCAESYPAAVRLAQIVGVGHLTAMAFVLTIEDPDRFDKARRVGPFLGLTPRRDQSGEVDKQLPITKAGNPHLRRLLVQCAHYIIGPFGPDCDLRRFGLQLVSRGGRAPTKRATTAVARKLAVLMLKLWKSGESYEPFHRSGSPEQMKTA